MRNSHGSRTARRVLVPRCLRRRRRRRRQPMRRPPSPKNTTAHTGGARPLQPLAPPPTASTATADTHRPPTTDRRRRARPHLPHGHALRRRPLLVGRQARHGGGCEDLGVTSCGSASNNDPGVQVQLIEQAVAEGSDGIASALASPDQLIPPLQAAVAAGIPVSRSTRASNDYQEIGALTHVGQTEFIAGQGAGERFNELGATKILCGRQEESNVALEERCDGLADTFAGEVISEFVGLDADQTESEEPDLGRARRPIPTSMASWAPARSSPCRV